MGRGCRGRRAAFTGGQALYFDGIRFFRSGAGIDNCCGREARVAAAIFE